MSKELILVSLKWAFEVCVHLVLHTGLSKQQSFPGRGTMNKLV